MSLANLDRIDPELLGDLVHLSFNRKPRLGSAVAALWSAGRLVCEHTKSFEFVSRNIVSNRLKRAGVEGACDAVASVSAAIEKGPEVHRGYRAVVLYACLHPHQHRVPAAMAVENF